MSRFIPECTLCEKNPCRCGAQLTTFKCIKAEVGQVFCESKICLICYFAKNKLGIGPNRIGNDESKPFHKPKLN